MHSVAVTCQGGGTERAVVAGRWVWEERPGFRFYPTSGRLLTPPADNSALLQCGERGTFMKVAAEALITVSWRSLGWKCNPQLRGVGDRGLTKEERAGGLHRHAFESLSQG